MGWCRSPPGGRRPDLLSMSFPSPTRTFLVNLFLPWGPLAFFQRQCRLCPSTESAFPLLHAESGSCPPHCNCSCRNSQWTHRVKVCAHFSLPEAMLPLLHLPLPSVMLEMSPPWLAGPTASWVSSHYLCLCSFLSCEVLIVCPSYVFSSPCFSQWPAPPSSHPVIHDPFFLISFCVMNCVHQRDRLKSKPCTWEGDMIWKRSLQI